MDLTSTGKALLIVTLGLTPPIVSMICLRQAHKRAQARLRSAMATAEPPYFQRCLSTIAHQYVEGIGDHIGDFTCRFNARSPQIRCAVNPTGPCQTCSSYESITLTNSP